jgi:hypothetical protein
MLVVIQAAKQNKKELTQKKLRHCDFNKILPITTYKFYKMRQYLNAENLYNCLSSDISIREKKNYVYSLPISESRQDDIWETFINNLLAS